MDEGQSKSTRPVERQRHARLAGIAYIVTIVAGIFAEAYARGSLRVSGDAAATAANLSSADTLYRSAIFADVLMLSSYIAVTALLYLVFKPAGRALALVAACFSLTGIVLLAANTGLLLVAPMFLGDADYLAAFTAEQRETLAYLIMRLHGGIYGLTGAFFGAYCLLIGWLIVRSRDLPRLIGWLMALAGVTFLLDTSLDLIAPSLARQLPDQVMAISLIGEGSVAIWLALFGIKRPTLMARTENAEAARGA